MPARKRTGAGELPVRKRRTLGTTRASTMSGVATLLLIKWAWGMLASADVQELALAIRLAGNNEDEMDDLASCGTYGEQKSNILRDLNRKCCKAMMVPHPFKVRAPYKDKTTAKGIQLFTEISIFLPSQWLSVLTQEDSLEYELDASFGTSQLEGFWGMQSTKNPKLKIILCLSATMLNTLFR